VDALPYDALQRVAARIAPLGWHTVIYFEAPDLPGLFDFLLSLPTPLVIDHMGRPDLAGQPTDAAFQRLHRLLREHNNAWCKVTCPERLSTQGPPAYEDFVPFARSLVEAFPDRVLWGTDWPHPNMRSHMPDDGDLVDMIPRIAPTTQLQQKLLVDNPVRLYWTD
jgi:2-pyrone-4,6-dicarboxylate lactonase